MAPQNSCLQTSPLRAKHTLKHAAGHSANSKSQQSNKPELASWCLEGCARESAASPSPRSQRGEQPDHPSWGSKQQRGLTSALHVNRTWKCERLWLYLCCGGGRLQQPLLLPQAAGHDAGDLHGLLQVLALEMLLDPAQVMLIEDVVLLQEAAVLLVYFPQEVVEDQCGMRLFVGSIRPCWGED